jgi:hypothetical protein
MLVCLPAFEAPLSTTQGIVTWYGGFEGFKRGEQETEGRSNSLFTVNDNIAVTAMNVHTCGTPRLAVS